MIIFNSIILLFCVMLLASLSGYFAERSGTVNIGINGMMLTGSLVYWILQKNISGQGSNQILLILISCVSGIFVGLIFGLSAITFKANQIISGTAINMVSSSVALLLMAKAQSADRLISNVIWNFSSDPTSWKYMLSFALLLTIIIVALSFVFIRYTSIGLRFRSAGESPQSLDSQGISVIKYRYLGIILSGATAGIAGAIFIQKIGAFGGNVHGLGFVGLTILIAGQWRIPFILIAATIFSSIYSVADNLQTIQSSLSEIKPLIQTIPFILSLGFLVLFSKSSLAPASAGTAYDKSKR